MTILKKAPEGAQVLDLGAARAARAEVRASRGEGNPYLKLAAGFVQVKPEIPLIAAFMFQAEHIEAGLKEMLVDPADVEALLADGLTSEDMKELAKFVAGKSLGESLASPSL